MKPFVRFGGSDSGSNAALLRCAWDFDDVLQKRLLDLFRDIASAEDLVRLGTEQWKKNISPPVSPVDVDLEWHEARLAYCFDHFRNRYRTIQQVLPTNAAFLYIGCGGGDECFALQRNTTRRITGIDSHVALLRSARELGKKFHHPVQFAAMDVLDLGFRDASFDGFLIEFYGFLPLQSQVESLQWTLARILKREGIGLVVASRKKYFSYWFKMGSSWPPSMVKWLAGQASLDFAFTVSDAYEERLMYGLYNRSHTKASLSAELSKTFEMLDCDYTPEDPRYVLATVRKRERSNEESYRTFPVPANQFKPLRKAEIERAMSEIETICNHLENHAEEVADYFVSGDKNSSCLSRFSGNRDAFLDLFQAVTREKMSCLSAGQRFNDRVRQRKGNAISE